MKKNILFFTCLAALVVLLLLPTGAEEKTRVTLDEAVRAGIGMNLDTKNRTLESLSLAAAETNARLKKRFTLDWNVYYLYKSEQMEIVLPDMNPAPGIIIPGTRMSAGAKHNVDMKLALVQPLYTGGALDAAVELEHLRGAVEENLLELSKITAAADIKTSYFTYRLLCARLASLDVLLKRLELHRQRVQDYFREDLVRKSDLLETEAKIQEQTLERLDVEQQVEQEKINFKALCGYDVSAVEEGCSEKDLDIEQALAVFLAHHPLLASLDGRAAAAAVREDLVKAAYLPRLGAFAELHYGKPGIDFFANEWSLYFQGGLSLDFRLFDWNKKKQDIHILQYESEKIANEKADFIARVKKNLEQLYAAKKSAVERLAVIDKLVQIADEDSTLKEGLLQEEQIANIDYLDTLTQKERCVSMRHTIAAQLELIKVKINLLTGKTDTGEDR